MRYILIDKITGFETNRTLTAVKNATFSDGLANGFDADRSSLPATMLTEAMAQAAGLLVAASDGYRAQPVLAKVQRLRVYKRVAAGDRIEIRADLEDLNEAGARIRVRADLEGVPLAEAIVFLALVSFGDSGEENNERRRRKLKARLATLFPNLFEKSPNGAAKI